MPEAEKKSQIKKVSEREKAVHYRPEGNGAARWTQHGGQEV
jgi:hypothetical protein